MLSGQGRARMFAAVALIAGIACSQVGRAVGTSARDNQWHAAVDERGYVDVWQLRRDVARVEALEILDEQYACYPDMAAGPDSPTREQLIDQCAARTRARLRAYRAALASFNAAWLPTLREAISKGDPIAEVVMRQCSTTNVLDRSGFESSCDTDAKRRSVAAQRLRRWIRQSATGRYSCNVPRAKPRSRSAPGSCCSPATRWSRSMTGPIFMCPASPGIRHRSSCGTTVEPRSKSLSRLEFACAVLGGPPLVVP